MKNINKILSKFRNKLRFEAVIRSLIIGAIAGLSVAIVMIICSFVLTLDMAVTSLFVGLGVCIAVTVLLYFVKYLPTEQELSARVDMMGLEERLITMNELKDKQCYMAQLQRKDTEEHILHVQNQKLILSFSRNLIVICIGILCIFVASSVYAVAAEEGYAPQFEDIVGSVVTPEVEYLTLQYYADTGGMVYGAIYQVVSQGQDAEQVVAEAFEGYVFDGWSDCSTDSIRQDYEVMTSFEVTALFVPIGISSGDSPDSNSGELPDMEDMDDMEGEAPDDMSSEDGYEDNNNVLNGDTHYSDVYDKYYDEAEETLDSNVVSDEMRDFIELYLDAIA